MIQAQSTYKIECDNNYDVRRPTKDNDIPIINESRRSDYSTHQQRSSASPTSNIWLRLIEDEENIGNVSLNCTVNFDDLKCYPYRTFPTTHPTPQDISINSHPMSTSAQPLTDNDLVHNDNTTYLLIKSSNKCTLF